jgi:hypothetical protein
VSVRHRAALGRRAGQSLPGFGVTAAEFDRGELLAAESLELELGIKDAGGWDEYRALRDNKE